jgi:hypothetical protein
LSQGRKCPQHQEDVSGQIARCQDSGLSDQSPMTIRGGTYTAAVAQPFGSLQTSLPVSVEVVGARNTFILSRQVSVGTGKRFCALMSGLNVPDGRIRHQQPSAHSTTTPGRAPGIAANSRRISIENSRPRIPRPDTRLATFQVATTETFGSAPSVRWTIRSTG